MEFTREEKVLMYNDLVKGRVMGEKVIEYIMSGKIAGAIHPCLGQEAIGAGVLAAYRKSGLKTYATGTHRGQILWAERIGWDPFIGELLGRKAGKDDGISGEYHLTDLENGCVLGTGALGGAWAILNGVAWALKNEGRNDKEVVFAPYGDGASSEGATYEALQMAALKKLPIMFFIENNQFAMTTPVERQYPLKELSARGKAFGIPNKTIDGNDVLAVAEAVTESLQLASQCQPSIVEAVTLRWEGHYVGDPQDYRDPSYRDHLSEDDPVLRFQEKLLAEGIITEEDVKRVRAENEKMIEEAFDRGIASEFATKEEVLDYNRMYANFTGGLK